MSGVPTDSPVRRIGWFRSTRRRMFSRLTPRKITGRPSWAVARARITAPPCAGARARRCTPPRSRSRHADTAPRASRSAAGRNTFGTTTCRSLSARRSSCTRRRRAPRRTGQRAPAARSRCLPVLLDAHGVAGDEVAVRSLLRLELAEPDPPRHRLRRDAAVELTILLRRQPLGLAQCLVELPLDHLCGVVERLDGYVARRRLLAVLRFVANRLNRRTNALLKEPKHARASRLSPWWFREVA